MLPSMTLRMHEVVANVMCKLVEMPAFRHIKNKLESLEEPAAVNYSTGERASKEIVEWCQDQWRRKRPVLPRRSCDFSGTPMCTPLFSEAMPLCHICGIPCPVCREELELDMPAEHATLKAIENFEDLHSANQGELYL